ncbi:hypothetical protein DC58_03350 [Vibrio navarrensis]|nr:hypothetical protein DC58_03350 [Vibrio navarrensis]
MLKLIFAQYDRNNVLFWRNSFGLFCILSKKIPLRMMGLNLQLLCFIHRIQDDFYPEQKNDTMLHIDNIKGSEYVIKC